MFRFDPMDKEHEKYEIKGAKHTVRLDNDSKGKTTAMEAGCDEKSKTFWMNNAFASDLSNKMKRGEENRKGAISENANSFSFGFSHHEEKPEDKGFSLLSKFSQQNAEVEHLSKPQKANRFQYDSSEEESEATPQEPTTTQSNRINRLIENLKLKKSESSSCEGKFALKLKEKAVAQASLVSSENSGSGASNKVIGGAEPFFFTSNDIRFDEAFAFLKEAESMDTLRTNFEEKRPILAEIFRKKMRNKAKKQEKMSFSGGSGGKKMGAFGKRNKFGGKRGPRVRFDSKRKH